MIWWSPNFVFFLQRSVHFEGISLRIPGISPSSSVASQFEWPNRFATNPGVFNRGSILGFVDFLRIRTSGKNHGKLRAQPFFLGLYGGWDPTQFYGVYNKAWYKDPHETTRIMEPHAKIMDWQWLDSSPTLVQKTTLRHFVELIPMERFWVVGMFSYRWLILAQSADPERSWSKIHD